MIGSAPAETPAVANPRTTRKALVAVLAISGVTCWCAGAAALWAGHAYLGIVLRGLALLLSAILLLRKPTLLAWTFFFMLAGVEVGLDFPRIAAQSQLPGDLFLRLIRMAVAPLILTSIPAGIAAHDHLRSVGRVALKAIVLFEVVTTAGLIIGSVAESISGAGWGIALHVQSASSTVAAQQDSPGWQQTFLNIFPENIAQAIAENQLLQIVVFALLFGIALASLPQKNRAPVVNLLQLFADTIFQMVRFLMCLAPLAAGSAMAYTVGRMGLAALIPLAKLVDHLLHCIVRFHPSRLAPSSLYFPRADQEILFRCWRASCHWFRHNHLRGRPAAGYGTDGRVRRATVDMLRS